MAKPTISRIRACIRSQNYAVSIHASEELDDGNLTIYDLESIILTDEIVERQRDRKTHEAKFVIRGVSLAALEAETVVKFNPKTALSSSSRSILPSCAACGHKHVELRKVTRSFGRGASLLIIEKIPLWSCPHCGESYFSAQTMHEIERIKTLRKSVAVDRPVSVAEFQELHA